MRGAVQPGSLQARAWAAHVSEHLTALAAASLAVPPDDAACWLAAPLAVSVTRGLDAWRDAAAGDEILFVPDSTSPDGDALLEGLAEVIRLTAADGRTRRLRLCATWKARGEPWPWEIDFCPHRKSWSLHGPDVQVDRHPGPAVQPRVALPLRITAEDVVLTLRRTSRRTVELAGPPAPMVRQSVPVAAALAAVAGLWHPSAAAAAAAAAAVRLAISLGGREGVALAWPFDVPAVPGLRLWNLERLPFHMTASWLAVLVVASAAAAGTAAVSWLRDPLALVFYGLGLPLLAWRLRPGRGSCGRSGH